MNRQTELIGEDFRLRILRLRTADLSIAECGMRIGECIEGLPGPVRGL
jgi:hypothetical protein